MKNIYTLILLCFIVLSSIVLRFWQLGAIPVSPDWDEVSMGYNAYSILKTGRDEYGSFMPLTIRSFDDYKPPLYTYLTVPAVGLFGLSVWAVRMPSAIFGVLAVIGTYFLTRELVRLAKDARKPNGAILGLSPEAVDGLPFLASFLMAISPWHIQFSRIAFEANIGVTLNIWAAYFFLKGLYTRMGFIISAVLFVLSLYAYHSERIFVPCLVVFLFFVYRKRIFARPKTTIVVAIIMGLVVIAPLVPMLFNKNALMRLKGTSSFRQQTELLSNNVKKLEYDRSQGYLLGMLFDNRRIEYAKTIIGGYLVHFWPRWLFITGDHERHHAPDMGLLYLWEMPFILIGIYRLLRGKGPSHVFFLGWFLLAPIAASPTTQLPHAIRTLVFLPAFQVFTAIGLLSSYSYIKAINPKVWVASLLGISAVIAVSFAYYVHMYFVHTNAEYSKYWLYGYKQAVEYAEEHKREFKKVVVSTDLEQPYIFFLFYTRFDPKKYLSAGGTISGSFDEKYNHFDMYEFRKIDWPNEKKDGSTLYIGTPDEIVHPTRVNITYLDGTPAIGITDRE